MPLRLGHGVVLRSHTASRCRRLPVRTVVRARALHFAFAWRWGLSSRGVKIGLICFRLLRLFRLRQRLQLFRDGRYSFPERSKLLDRDRWVFPGTLAAEVVEVDDSIFKHWKQGIPNAIGLVVNPTLTFSVKRIRLFVGVRHSRNALLKGRTNRAVGAFTVIKPALRPREHGDLALHPQFLTV